MLYPTGVAYSTSYTKEEHKSTFNFLMLLNHRDFPSDADSGVLPKSLLELAEDKTPTVDGVFGISVYEFENIFVDKLSQKIEAVVKNKLKDNKKFNILEFTKQKGNNYIQIKFEYKLDQETDAKGTLSIQYKGITKEKNSKAISINYDIELNGEFHRKQKLHNSSTEFDCYWNFSTEGESKEKKGKKGKLTVALKAANEGKLNLKPSYNTFSLNYNDDPKKPTRIEDNSSLSEKLLAGLKDGILSSLPVVNLVYVFETIYDLFQDDVIDFKSLNELADIINIENLGDLEKKVILPVASVYTYKNVRLMGTGDSAVILFDTTYAPVSK